MEQEPKREPQEEQDIQALASGIFNFLTHRYGNDVSIIISSYIDGNHTVCKIYIERKTTGPNDLVTRVPKDVSELLHSYKTHHILPKALQCNHSKTQNETGGDVHIITLTI